ncbi:hypothetical protein C8R45DRAFT_1104068 [Mycena sanguinolenta]|nr:hypothetical protein C8R45DRAFT_1104068 [Mycena sanguinolenta]
MFPVAHFMALWYNLDLLFIFTLSAPSSSVAALPMLEVPGIPTLPWRTRMHACIPELADLPFASPRLEFATDVECLSHGWGHYAFIPSPVPTQIDGERHWTGCLRAMVARHHS